MIKSILISLCLLTSITLVGQDNFRRTEAQAKDLIDSLYKQLKSGADFKTLANKYSDDPATNKMGGKYAPTKVGTMTSEFESIVLKLKVYEISRPFKTSFGYHIAQLLKRQADTYTVRHILITFDE